MRPIPLNLMTLYADLADGVIHSAHLPGSISTKKVKAKSYLYAVVADGTVKNQIFIGPADDPDARRIAELYREAEQQAKQRRSTVSALKNARLPAPSLQVGKVLETIGRAGLYDRGITLIGTHAFRLFPPLLGHFLPSSALATNDVDISAAAFVAADDAVDFEAVLKRADPSFKPVWHADDQKPRMFRASNQLTVDLLTRQKRGGRSPVIVDGLGVAAEALAFQEYLTEDTVESVALYKAGVRVRIPLPARYAVHKLIVAGRRGATNPKAVKDLRQAQELIDILLEQDETALEEALADARGRGQAWKTVINHSLRQLGREARQGRLPIKLDS